MSLVTITRLTPNKLQLIQLLTTHADSLLIDVIKGLQASFAVNLNTICPTCIVNDNPTGFVEATLKNGQAIPKLPCPTCKGYLLYNTNGGGLTSPTNPFSNLIIVSQVLPADINEALLGFPSAITLDTMIIALQGNTNYSLTTACPNCANGVAGVSTGNTLIGNIKITCPLCCGMQKTVRPYQMVNGVPRLIIPNLIIPNPLPELPYTKMPDNT